MNLKHFLLAAGAFLAIGTATYAQDSTPMDDPMTRAVMESYEKMLQSNPKDYLVYFRRANEYYNHNEYSKAMADINNALQYAPAKEKDMRFQCYCLRASIYERMKQYPEAIADLDEALKISPTNYTMLYQKANIEYASGNYAAAQASYKKLQSLNPRSQEALFGLARVAVTEGDQATARKYIDEAVALTPSAPEGYMHRAEILTLMADNKGAVEDYVTAISLGSGNNVAKSLRALLALGDTDYYSTYTGLSNAIAKAPRQSVYYYIRGVIAQSHYKYPSAIKDFEYLISNDMLDYPGVYRMLAECYFALGNYDKAVENADMAIGSSVDNLDAYVVKADAKRALGSARQGVTAADRALQKDRNYAPALVARALCEIDQNLLTEASTDAGNACLDVPGDAYYKLLRAWVLKDYVKMPDQATAYYNDVLKLDTYVPTDPRSLRGFALLALGDTAGADAWTQAMLAAAPEGADGEAEYYAACYYAQAGNADKALDCMERALKKGYANYYQWTADSAAGVNVAPLRSDSRFKPLLDRYAFIFNVN